MNFSIRDVRNGDYRKLGELMVEVYSSLDGFPSQSEQPDYYRMLMDVGRMAEKPGVRVLVAEGHGGILLGGIVYFSDMASYGSGGSATSEKSAAGIRLLAVSPKARGAGLGKALTLACLDLAREQGRAQMILHTTGAMRVAWGMYERLGFRRSPNLDFTQVDLPVFGFRLLLNKDR